MADAAALPKLARSRRVVNTVTRYVVALGGAAVIVAIALIFFYLLWIVLPMFAPADIETGSRYALPDARPLLVDANDSGDIGVRIDASGAVAFFDLASGTLRKRVTLGGTALTRAQEVPDHPGLYALLDIEGGMSFVEARYTVSFHADARIVSPELEFAFEEDWVEIGQADAFDVHYRGSELLVAALSGNILTLRQFRDVEPGFALERPRQGRLRLPRHFDHVYFGPRGRLLYLISMQGAVRVLDLARPTAPAEQYTGRLAPEGVGLTAVAPLLGRYSLLVADEQMRLGQWFMVKSASGQRLERIRQFEVERPLVRIVPEPRRKGFAAIDRDDRLHLFYTTSERHLASHPLAMDPVTASIAPRSDLLLAAAADGAVQAYRLQNEHPEISWSTLWSKVWYEGYPEPVHSWQSSSAETDFEPKFSLTPLLFGTLKGAFYALLFAVPVAIMGAVYTAYFMAPAMRRIVKPGIEIMAALPTVILGFLAGLWLAPLVEAHLTAVLSLLVVMPALTLAAAWGWSRLPDRFTAPFEGWYALLAIPVIVATVWIAFAVGPWLEILLFQGNVQAWMLEHLGLPYDQRNALVVGLAMGLAVIPTIFSIAEDAIYGVPTHLINGSLALGATPWQTLTRVVVLTASPGIFSAVMIGLGRAVGETMIVLMATGNTPIMDLNIFEGMRTFAANIAVELPESEVGSTHYRLLFLTALVLFLLTFVFNTAAELVRQRLRSRYGSL